MLVSFSVSHPQNIFQGLAVKPRLTCDLGSIQYSLLNVPFKVARQTLQITFAVSRDEVAQMTAAVLAAWVFPMCPANVSNQTICRKAACT